MKFIAKTLFGLENVLASELNSLGAKDVTVSNRAVMFSGNQELLYSVNYMSRLSLSVLWVIGEFYIKSAEDLYRLALKIKWEEYIDARQTFAITPVVNSRHFNHTGFAALKLKDAIADRFRDRTGSRPSVDTANADILINLHISNERVTVSIDTSGAPLFRRGYRKMATPAPLNEVLAAGMISLSKWDGKVPLTDPMCGSGTIPVEAAMTACRIPAGMAREGFGFQKWRGYDADLFQKVKSKCDSDIIRAEVVISGSDIAPDAIRKAEANAANILPEGTVVFSVRDFREFSPADNEGVVFINPPYGERISQGETDEIYDMIGTRLKHAFEGHTAWIISSNRESMKHIGLKPSEKHTLFNGSLECQFVKFELYKGSRKAH